MYVGILRIIELCHWLNLAKARRASKLQCQLSGQSWRRLRGRGTDLHTHLFTFSTLSMSFTHTHTQTLTENARIITNNNNRKKTWDGGMWCLVYFVFLFFSRLIFTRIFRGALLNVNCVHNVRQPKANCGHSAREDLDRTGPRQSKAQSIIKKGTSGTPHERGRTWLVG